MSDTQEHLQHASSMERSRAAQRPLEQVRVLPPVCNGHPSMQVCCRHTATPSPSCTVAGAAWSCELSPAEPDKLVPGAPGPALSQTCWHRPSLPSRPLQAAARHQTHLQAVKEPHKFAGEGADTGKGHLQQCRAPQKRKQVRLGRPLQTFAQGRLWLQSCSSLLAICAMCISRSGTPCIPPRCMVLHLKPRCAADTAGASLFAAWSAATCSLVMPLAHSWLPSTDVGPVFVMHGTDCMLLFLRPLPAAACR